MSNAGLPSFKVHIESFFLENPDLIGFLSPRPSDTPTYSIRSRNDEETRLILNHEGKWQLDLFIGGGGTHSSSKSYESFEEALEAVKDMINNENEVFPKEPANDTTDSSLPDADMTDYTGIETSGDTSQSAYGTTE